jgi:hypothetical protein
LRRWAGLGAALALLSACAPQKAALPAGPIPAGPGVRVVASPVAEWLAGSEPPVSVGTFAYAGGVALTSPDTSRLHGLSDLDVQPDGRLVAVSDEGDLVRGRLLLDAKGRPTGLADVTVRPLTAVDGKPLSGGKSDSDSEGLALWPNGDLMISFEGQHRIWLYPAGGGTPHEVPKPDSDFPINDGMEALARDPDAGPDAYLVGREDTRQTWTCRLSAPCIPYLRPGREDYGKLVAARAFAGGRWAFLFRDFQPLAGVTTHILITDRAGKPIDVKQIARPATVDNFEGIAVLPRPDGSARIYLISDDNFAGNQRTLLLAFDWRPKTGGHAAKK